MVLNLINIIGVVLVWVLLFPHLIYAVRSAEGTVSCSNKFINLIAQVGRYASMILMVLPLGIGKFGFPSDINMIVYFAANILLLAAYIIAWVIYSKKPSFTLQIVLNLLEAGVFFTCGFCLSHLFLVIASVIFAIGNIVVTVLHNKEANEDD